MQGWRWSAPPQWPPPPAGWAPPVDWQPDPSWPPAPAQWQWWAPPAPRWIQRLPVILTMTAVALVLLLGGAVLLAITVLAPGSPPGVVLTRSPSWSGALSSTTLVVAALTVVLIPFFAVAGGNGPELGQGGRARRERGRVLARQLRGQAPCDPADAHPCWQLASQWTSQVTLLLLGACCACGEAGVAVTGTDGFVRWFGLAVVGCQLAVAPVFVRRVIAGSRYLDHLRDGRRSAPDGAHTDSRG